MVRTSAVRRPHVGGHHARKDPQAPSAPGTFHQLVSAYVNVAPAQRDRVYAYAGTNLRRTHDAGPAESVARFVEPAAEAELEEDTRARAVLQSEVWGDHAGAIYPAIVNPSFALGFALA